MRVSVALKPVKVKRRRARTSSYPSPPTSLSPAAPQPKALLAWYDRNRRLLPWRALPGQAIDPYRVWLSEIMLQQTTVATVGPYFEKFIKRWPSLSDLAAASLDDVLRLWAGLGYYRRARMLHQCARTVQDMYGGVFPCDEKQLLDLPGFGPYTAAALRAIAFDQPANVVDGNVERVMARIFAVREALPRAKPLLRAAAARVIPLKRHGDYAQALMDLGATLCTPRSPQCNRCPWQSTCQAYALGIQETLPIRALVKTKPTRRAIAFVLRNADDSLLLRARPPSGLLPGMMEVPSSPWEEGPMPTLRVVQKYAPHNAQWHVIEGCVTHVFSHFTLEVQVVTAQVRQTMPGYWVTSEALAAEALPTVMKKIIHHALNSL